MKLEYWAETDIGRKRSHNEDNFLIDSDLGLFVVADGLGGHASGDLASALAVHAVRDAIVAEKSLLSSSTARSSNFPLEVCTLLEYASHAACDAIQKRAREEPDKRGMGTTLISLLIHDDRAYVSHVGDSRIYLVRGGVVYQLTEDHSVANELSRQGRADSAASEHPGYQYAMTRAVGPGRKLEVDTLDFDLVEGDCLLMCTDGLYEYMDDRDISRALAMPDLRDIPAELLSWANDRGGQDNITAVAIRLGGNELGRTLAAQSNAAMQRLRGVELFEQLNYQQLLRLMHMTRNINVEAGRALFSEGDEADAMYIVLSGRIRLHLGELTLADLGPGHHFGEMALIDDRTRSATATAVSDAHVLTVLRSDFHDVLRKESPMAVKLLWGLLKVLNARLRDTTANLGSVANSQFDLPKQA